MLKVQLGCEVAVGIVADGFTHEVFGKSEVIGEIPELIDAVLQQVQEFLLVDIPLDGCTIGAVFTFAAVIANGMDIEIVSPDEDEE